MKTFTLRYKRPCPFAIYGQVTSPVTDDCGQTVTFAGTAYVDEITTTHTRKGEVESEAIVHVYRPIK